MPAKSPKDTSTSARLRARRSPRTDLLHLGGTAIGDFDPAIFFHANHALRNITRRGAENDSLRIRFVVVIPSAARITGLRSGDFEHRDFLLLPVGLVIDDANVDGSRIDGAIVGGRDFEFTIDFRRCDHRLRDAFEKGCPSGGTIADLRADTAGFLHQLGVRGAGAGRLFTIRIRTLDPRIRVVAPSIQPVKKIIFEHGPATGMKNSWWKHVLAVVGIRSARECFKIARTQPGVVIGHHHDRLGGFRPQPLCPGLSPSFFSLGITLGLIERAQKLFERLRTANVDARLELALSVAAIIVARQRRRNAYPIALAHG